MRIIFYSQSLKENRVTSSNQKMTLYCSIVITFLQIRSLKVVSHLVSISMVWSLNVWKLTGYILDIRLSLPLHQQKLTHVVLFDTLHKCLHLLCFFSISFAALQCHLNSYKINILNFWTQVHVSSIRTVLYFRSNYKLLTTFLYLFLLHQNFDSTLTRSTELEIKRLFH